MLRNVLAKDIRTSHSRPHTFYDRFIFQQLAQLQSIIAKLVDVFDYSIHSLSNGVATRAQVADRVQALASLVLVHIVVLAQKPISATFKYVYVYHQPNWI